MTRPSDSRGRALGRIPTFSASKREAVNKDRRIDGVGEGLQTTATCTLKVGAVETIAHGLKAIPACVSITGAGTAAPGVYVVSRTRDSVKITNDGPNEATVEVGIFG
jgi:hypothetical protein